MVLGTTELVIIGILAIFLFGAKRIPELARNMGQAKGEFQAGMFEVTSPSSAEADMDRGGVTEEVAAEPDTDESE
jgi:sec-independent protein translocase protein TatA